GVTNREGFKREITALYCLHALHWQRCAWGCESCANRLTPRYASASYGKLAFAKRLFITCNVWRDSFYPKTYLCITCDNKYSWQCNCVCKPYIHVMITQFRLTFA